MGVLGMVLEAVCRPLRCEVLLSLSLSVPRPFSPSPVAHAVAFFPLPRDTDDGPCAQQQQQHKGSLPNPESAQTT